MVRAFSVVSWNVEHFGATDKRKRKPKKPIGPIIDFLVAQNADVVALYEVESSIVFKTVVQKMSDYHFHITEGPQIQEILIGVRRKFTSFFSQRLEFKSAQSTLRPGALLTLVIDGAYYPLLFLHLKSLTKPRGFGLRDDMTEKALRFRKALDKAAGGAGLANYIFIGDLNTMGMNLTYSKKDITGEEEIARLQARADSKSVRMLVQEKPQPYTYWPGAGSAYDPSNLDHVVAAKHLQFRSFGGFSVDVRGWPLEPTDEKRDAWAEKYSDHALLYFEVQKV